ncbi:MAG: DUF2281 domain-containing protein [Deltaproteobacteria bacterium]|nr:DUF2281 domain-containing protein [Deltaproteobacteria bacterium]
MDIAASVMKKQLLGDIKKLPREKLQEVLDFVGYLLAKERKAKEDSENELDPALDPLLKFIAGTTHGSLAKGIDNELYGE